MPDDFRAAIAAAIALGPEGPNLVVVQATEGEDFDVDWAIAKAAKFFPKLDEAPAWVIEIPDIGKVLEDLVKNDKVSVFYTDAVPGSLFATTEPLIPGKSSVLAAGGTIGVPIPEPPPIAADVVEKRVSKIIKTAEERFVLGIVLVPETVDSQGDIYSAEEVRKAAHGYMEDAGHIGKQHGEIITGKIKILENYIAPADFEEGGEKVVKGTWLMGARVVDDDIWEAVKEGSFSGFSIGGSAVRKPNQDT